MSKKQPNPFHGTLPKEVLRQMGEHTVGGFIIFYFNQETGFPEQILSLDSHVHYMALQKYISDWAEALHNLNIVHAEEDLSDLEKSLQQSRETPQPPDNDDDDDDSEGQTA